MKPQEPSLIFDGNNGIGPSLGKLPKRSQVSHQSQYLGIVIFFGKVGHFHRSAHGQTVVRRLSCGMKTCQSFNCIIRPFGLASKRMGRQLVHRFDVACLALFPPLLSGIVVF
jgi:hypothetical protein